MLKCSSVLTLIPRCSYRPKQDDKVSDLWFDPRRYSFQLVLPETMAFVLILLP